MILDLKKYNEWLEKSLLQLKTTKEKQKKNIKRTTTTLVFSMEKPRITGSNSLPWLEFDIMVSSNSSSTYLDRCLIKYSYDNSFLNSAFGSNIVSNNNIQITRASAFNTATYLNPQTDVVDISSHLISIPFGTNYLTSPFNRVNITTTPQKMLTIRIKIKTKEVGADWNYNDTSFTPFFSFYSSTINGPISSNIGYDYTNYNGSNNDLT
jgi:hypothetical protein